MGTETIVLKVVSSGQTDGKTVIWTIDGEIDINQIKDICESGSGLRTRLNSWHKVYGKGETMFRWTWKETFANIESRGGLRAQLAEALEKIKVLEAANKKK
jgi:hypothetical protein